jgi:hypothetical protein
MSKTLAELLQMRADMSLADLTSVGGVGGGVLVPEQAEFFLDLIYDQPTIFQDARQVVMLSPTKNIDRLGFNQRLMHATPGENTALSSGNRTKPAITEIQLVAKDYVGEVDIPYDVLTDSLERGNFETHIMTHIAKKVALDLAEFALQGDTTSSDPDYAVQDGWLKLCSSHTVDAAGAVISEDIMNRWYKAVPDKYLQNDAGWAFYLQRGVAVDWRHSVGGRMTPGGDAALRSGDIPPYSGIPVKKDNTIKSLPNTGFVQGLFVHPENLIIGIWKEITIETFRQIQTRTLQICIHMRAAFAVEQPDAASLLNNIAIAA